MSRTLQGEICGLSFAATHSVLVLTYAELDLKNTKPVGVDVVFLGNNLKFRYILFKINPCVGILLRILDILQQQFLEKHLIAISCDEKL